MANTHTQHRIVVIDDDPDVRELVQMLLNLDDRFELVGVATDGESGIDLVHELRPDAVIVDLELPRADGLTVVARVRELVPDTRIIVFSAFPDPFTLMDVLRCGADGYLDKAVAWAELLPTVAELCESMQLH